MRFKKLSGIRNFYANTLLSDQAFIQALFEEIKIHRQYIRIAALPADEVHDIPDSQRYIH